jgi:hypothetical protein
MVEIARPMHNWVKEWHQLNSDAKGSPEMSKKGKSRVYKSPATVPPEVSAGFPDSYVVNGIGITPGVSQFLEVGRYSTLDGPGGQRADLVHPQIAEVVGQMAPLFSYCVENQDLPPYEALDQYVATIITPTMGQGGPGQVPGAMNPPPGVMSAPGAMGGGGPGGAAAVVGGQMMMQGPPGMIAGGRPGQPGPSAGGGFPGQFAVGASPAAAHLQLPGSPHVGSPASVMAAGGGAMGAPTAMPQGPQQAGGGPVNTSPATNKRRRPSTATKHEDETGATPIMRTMNGVPAKAKPSPRAAKKQRAA